MVKRAKILVKIPVVILPKILAKSSKSYQDTRSNSYQDSWQDSRSKSGQDSYQDSRSNSYQILTTI